MRPLPWVRLIRRKRTSAVRRGHRKDLGGLGAIRRGRSDAHAARSHLDNLEATLDNKFEHARPPSLLRALCPKFGPAGRPASQPASTSAVYEGTSLPRHAVPDAAAPTKSAKPTKSADKTKTEEGGQQLELEERGMSKMEKKKAAQIKRLAYGPIPHHRALSVCRILMK